MKNHPLKAKEETEKRTGKAEKPGDERGGRGEKKRGTSMKVAIVSADTMIYR